MRSIFTFLIGPPGVIFLGALFVAFGTVWATRKNEANSVRQTSLLQDISARSGNKTETDNLIRERSRAIVSNSDRADEVADAIIKRLPNLTEEFKALEKRKLNQYEERDLDFRLKWEPIIRSTLEKFDLLVTQCRKRGIELETAPVKDFPFTYDQTQGMSAREYAIREARFGNVGIRINYRPVGVLPNGYSDGHLNITYGELKKLPFITGADFGLNLTPDYADCMGQKFAAPPNGILPKKFTECIDRGIADSFERFLVMGNAAKSVP
jgi:hypothetical protein